MLTKVKGSIWNPSDNGVNPYIYNVANYDVIADGTTDYGLILQSIIDEIPDRQLNIGGGGVWEYGNCYVIYFPPSASTYVTSKKLVVPNAKNIVFATESPAGAVLEYTGASNFAIEFQPGSIAKSIGITNLGIKNGGVSIIGTNGGDIHFDHVFFYNSPDYGLYFVNGPDYTDGDDYINPGDFTATSSGVNTVFVTMDKCQFHYCNKGLGIVATTILLFNCFKPRFNGTTNAPMTIDATGVTITEPEFQGVVNRSTVPYIHFPLTNPTAHIFFNGGRFGSEEFSIAQYGGRSFGAPHSSILFGEFGAYSAPANVAQNIEFRNFVCEADNTAPKDTDHLVWLAGDARQLRFVDCEFINYQGDLINEVAFDGDGTVAQRCEFRTCNKQATSIGEWFSSGGQGWKRTEERLEFIDTDTPFVAGSTHSNTFVDGDVNVGTDRITITNHGFVSSQQVQLTTTGTLPAGLALATNYYVKRIDADIIELYTTSSLTSIADITAAAGTGTHTITGQGASGASPTATITSSSNDARGTVIITTGTSAGTGNLFNLSFYREYDKPPKVLLMGANAAAGGLNMSISLSTTYGVALRSNTALASSTAYIFDYIVVG